ncbi:hypothetical protein H4218_005339 [Coemansia sp. IMI 209128]|nr:hypothetical protein H4218_005339 [Coemansia sp. IMI 209128]
MPPSPSSAASVGASTASRLSLTAAMTSRSPAHERMGVSPQPPSFAATSSPQSNASFAYAASPTGAARRGSGMPPEKTPVGRSGVFDDVYNADPYYRRHSVDMGVPMTGVSQYSPPRQRFQQTLPPQQPAHHQNTAHVYQPSQLHSQKVGGSHGFGGPVRFATRSGPGSPHPLSFDQTAGGLSPSRSGSERGMKRPLSNDDEDDDEEGANGYSTSPGPYPYDDEDDDDDGDRTTPRAGVATADKPYACDQCELSFSRQHNLKSHALTHSTERPFSCPICHTPFRRQHDLKRHMKLHTGEKPHTCTNCGRSFARLDALNRHMRAENFHACNQAAKKARTAAMPPDSGRHLEDPRLKSASAAYLEQRRASTTSSQPPGAPPNWSHWTHRPSIAADESMIRRLQERFGNGATHAGQYSSPQSGQPPRLSHAQPTNYASAADPRAYAHGQANGGPAYAGAPHSATPQRTQMQPPPALTRHTHAGTLQGQRQQPQSPSMTYSHGYGQGWQGGVAKPAAGRPAQLNSPHPHMRLPPIELAPPRRHSLAVTSHLERYRSCDATPPPASTQPLSNPAEAAGLPAAPPRTYPPPPPSLALYQLSGSRPQPSAPLMAPLPEGRATTGGPQLPPASFTNYSPSMRPPPAQETSAKPSPSSSGETPGGEYPLTTKSAVFPHQTLPPPVFRGAASVGSEVVADAKPRHPLHMQSMDGRRGSAYGVEAPLAPDNARRASIVALTNPQSEIDVRLENAELKRRLDEMETKYLREIERLNKAVRDLEIEKSMLKSLIDDRQSMSVSPSAGCD